MKEFNSKGGSLAGRTMTVSELKAKLDNYPDDMPVIATWEGVHAYIDDFCEEFEIGKVHKGDKSQECDCLIIDVESY